MSDAPTPQLAPVATGAAVESGEHRGEVARAAGPSSCGPRCRTSTSPRRGRRRAIAASAAARTSSGADIVSIHATSAPPATSASISSRKVSSASASVRLAERLEERAGRADRAGDDHRPLGGLGDLAGELGGRRASSPTRASAPWSASRWRLHAEGVRQDDVGAGVDEAAVQVLHPLGMVDVPELGRLAGVEAHRRSSWCRSRRRRAAPPGWRGARRVRRACPDRSAATRGVRGATFPRLPRRDDPMTDDVLDDLFSIRGKTAVDHRRHARASA